MATVMMRRMKRGDSGGGGLGSVIGTVAGAIGGSIVPVIGTAAGAAAGGTIGGVAGNMIDKPTASSSQEVPGSAIARRQESQPAYQSQSPILEESIKALSAIPPEEKAKYEQPLLQAYGRSLMQDYKRGLV